MMRDCCLVGWVLLTVMLGDGVAQTATQPAEPRVDDLRLADLDDRLERLEQRLEQLEGHERLAGVQVQSGEVSLPYHRADEPRPIIRDTWGGVQGRVVFGEPFENVPEVTLAFSRLDIFAGANTRIDARVIAVDRTGFDYQFFGWSNTHIYTASAVWIAVAQ